MKALYSLLGMFLLATVIGCGDAEGTKHKTDSTPGGDQGKPVEDFDEDGAMEDYAKEQEKLEN